MMKDYLAQVRQFYDSEKYDEALRVIVEAEEQACVSPALLVWKSRCLLLADNPSGDPTDSKTSLERALKLDDEYLPALIDLAYYYLNVMDDPEAALPIFRKALSLSTENATEIILGLGECISETDSPRVALEFLEKNAELMINSSKLQELKMELKNLSQE
jgi:tetratricopeptide (TPR) repeat protein